MKSDTSWHNFLASCNGQCHGMVDWISVFLKEWDTVYLCLPAAQLRWTYCIVSGWDLVFLHATQDVSLRHSQEMSQTCGGVAGFLRKLPWSNRPWSLHKHRNLAGLNHSQWRQGHTEDLENISSTFKHLHPTKLTSLKILLKRTKTRKWPHGVTAGTGMNENLVKNHAGYLKPSGGLLLVVQV